MNKKMAIIFDVVIGIFDTVMCIANIMQGKVIIGIVLGILAILIFGCAIMLKDL